MKKRILKRKIFWGALGGTTLITPVIFLSAVSCVPEIKKFKSNIFIDTNSVNETLFVNQNENLPVLSVKASADNQNVQLTYQWYESDTNSTTSGKPIPGATGATYTLSEVNTQKAGTKYYYAVVSASSGDAIVSSKISEIYTIKVSDQIPPINIKKQPENQTAIVNQTNDLPTFSVSATTNNSNEVLNYQWYSNTTNSSANGTKILGATNPLYKITNSDVLTPQSKYFYVKITGSINGIALNPVISNTVNLTVNALPKIFVQEQPQNADVSLNQTENLPTFSVAVENISNAQLNYQWYSNVTNSTNNGIAIAGANSSSLTVPTNDLKNVGTKYYYVKINGMLNGLNLAAINSNVATLIVNPLSIINISAQPQDIIALVNQTNNLPVLSVIATTNNNNQKLIYQWYSNTTNSTNNGSLIYGANESSYVIPKSDLKNAGTKYYYVKISGTVNGLSLTPVYSNPAILTITASPKITITSQPQNADVSLNQTENLPTFSVAVENISNAQLNYQWYSTTNTTGSNNDWQLISGATNSSYTVPASDAKRVGPKHYYVRVNGSINGVSLVGVNSGVATLRVNPLPRIIITNQPQNSDVLVNQTTNLPTLYVNATTGNTNINLNYQWYSNTTNSTNNGTACWSNLSFINHSC